MGVAELQSSSSTGIGQLFPPLEPRLAGHSLPGPYYWRTDLFDLELDLIHRKHWLFVGHAADVPSAGDYMTYSIGTDSVAVLRDDDGNLRAFHNVCRHRGSRLCTAEQGSVRRIVCPYHAWTYALDGSLKAARQMPHSFNRSRYSLQKVAVQEFCGLIFVCLSSEPPDFRPVQETAVPALAPYELGKTRVAKRLDYIVEANWKIIAENFRECYHCGPAHPQYCRAIVGATAADSPRLAREAEAARAEQLKHWVDLGLAVPEIEFGPGRVHLLQRFAYRGGYKNQSLDGGPVAPLLGQLKDWDTGVLAFTVRPNLWLEVTADHAVTMRHTPLGATRTAVRMTWLVRGDAVEGRDYDADNVAAFWQVTGEQDWEICRNTQLGVASRAYVPGPLAPSEGTTEEWLQWYLERIGGETQGPQELAP